MTSRHLQTDVVPPGTGWLVGTDLGRPPAAPSGAEQRAARLAARLEVYARYGTLMADEAAAVLRGDSARAEALSTERMALAEQFEELRAAAAAAAEAAGAAGGEAVAFADLLADALVEADHQTAVDLALRRQLEGVAAGLRALPAPDGPALAPGEPAAAAGDDAGSGESGRASVAGVVATFAGALIGARAQGVGGTLSGHFPGVAGGAGSAPDLGMGYGDDAGRGDAGRGGIGDGSRLDLRF